MSRSEVEVLKSDMPTEMKNFIIDQVDDTLREYNADSSRPINSAMRACGRWSFSQAPTPLSRPTHRSVCSTSNLVDLSFLCGNPLPTKPNRSVSICLFVYLPICVPLRLA
ncbi:tegumental protein [Echinococcus multilocularis]|uniref:Tegumental protein n=1 Tax=Echinococcus multilocularis TaxID=6211 RepID=A0A068XW45_ECHMU|nr:tegumental protein [Echinococcus multilocularis]